MSSLCHTRRGYHLQTGDQGWKKGIKGRLTGDFGIHSLRVNHQSLRLGLERWSDESLGQNTIHVKDHIFDL